MGFLRTAPLALGLLSACRSTDQRPTAPPGDAPPPTVEVPAVSPSAMAPTPDAAAPVAQPPTPQALFDSAQWKRFKTVWRQLDAYETSDSPDISITPRTALPHDKARALRDELESLGAPMRALTAEPAALDVLLRVADSRIDSLSGLRFRLMVSHRAPMESEMLVADMVLDLEKRIDALLLLRKQGKLDDKSTTAALASIREEIELMGLLQTFGPRMFFPVRMRDYHSIAELQAAVTARVDSAVADGGKSEELVAFKTQVDKAADTIAKARPWLLALLADLER
ncbi:MAG: hypothetical protein HY898_21030 [Deltaproteobacteria bacterium]|nr:hypothetical protein [Deltaproteobacteria bacterium]